MKKISHEDVQFDSLGTVFALSLSLSLSLIILTFVNLLPFVPVGFFPERPEHESGFTKMRFPRDSHWYTLRRRGIRPPPRIMVLPAYAEDINKIDGGKARRRSCANEE
jgi:hypothetical protein